MANTPERPPFGTRMTTLGRRVVGYAVLAIAVVLILRFAVGAVIGLVTSVLFVVAIVAALLAILWASGQVRSGR
jgi:hypothetical protein